MDELMNLNSLKLLPLKLITHFKLQRVISLLNIFIPQHCELCNCTISTAPNMLLCEFCEAKLERIEEACAVCSIKMNTPESICGDCIKTERHWDKCVSAYYYSDAMSQLIHKFKYQYELRLKHTLCSGLIDTVQFETDLPDILIPVPMSHSRLLKRGYNHSIILAKLISNSLEIPYAEAVIKKHETKSLAKLKAKQRSSSVKNSFALNTKIPKDLLKGKHIAIIDDVVTTGATSSEIARTLKRAKPESISVWCIARA